MSADGLLRIPDPRYRVLVGTGGIGAGSFFQVNGNHTLGREESRSGRFLVRRDYCKLHIVCHYVKTLAGPALDVVPIGCVGDDEVGRRLLVEMREAGMEMRRVRVIEHGSTLYSFCILYPDGSGGNLTTDNSACSVVTPAMIEEAGPDLAACRGHGITLAVPEVPLDARLRLLSMGGAHGFLRVASFTSGEMPAVDQRGWLSEVDLLALNVDEAGAFLALSADPSRPAEVVDRLVERIGRRYPGLRCAITAGSRGSWTWDGATLLHRAALPVPVVGTSGAGDAHLAGILSGLTGGLELHEAHILGTILAAASIASEHTINPEITRGQLEELARKAEVQEGRLLRLLDSRSG